MGCGASTQQQVGLVACSIHSLTAIPPQSMASPWPPLRGTTSLIALPTLIIPLQALQGQRSMVDHARPEPAEQQPQQPDDKAGGSDEPEVEEVLGSVQLWADKAASWFKGQAAQPAAAGQDPQDLDLQALQYKAPAASQALRKNSALGQVLVSGVQVAIRALPFCEPVAAALGAVYCGAQLAAQNSANCAQLLALVKRCDQQLASVLQVLGEQPDKASKIDMSTHKALQQLAKLLVEAGRFIHRYSRRGWVLQLMLSSSDRGVFTNFDTKIREAMQAGLALGAVDGEEEARGQSGRGRWLWDGIHTLVSQRGVL